MLPPSPGLSWSFADWTFLLRERLFIFDGYWNLHSPLFSTKEELVDWLSHISRVVRSVGEVLSQMLRHFFIVCIVPMCFSVMGFVSYDVR